MTAIRRHWRRWLVSLMPLALALAVSLGVLPGEGVARLDNFFYDARLRLNPPAGIDERVVIVDIDEKSLARMGQWPWPRNHLARLFDRLFGQYDAEVAAMDLVLAEPDRSSGYERLIELARGALAEERSFVDQVQSLGALLDHDGQLARAIRGRPVVLGYYFTSDRDGRRSGMLPAPVLSPGLSLEPGREPKATTWNGYGANLAMLMQAAPGAGFFNSLTDTDGVVRSLPLLARFEGQYYESLALAVYRQVLGQPKLGVQTESQLPGTVAGEGIVPQAVLLESPELHVRVPVDELTAALVPFKGTGGPRGGAFRYVSAVDVIDGALPLEALRGKIVLIGSTAPGLLDLRATPVSRVYPGVEVHAQLLAGMLDGQIKSRPDYAAGFELLSLGLAGLVLALALPAMTAGRGLLLSSVLGLMLVALNQWLYHVQDLVLPLALPLLTLMATLVVNMGYGYFFESRNKRELAQIFQSYVPPELVRQMLKDPERYSMQAQSRELTVLFCDMRGFTRLSETMEPLALQALLNDMFSRLTRRIRERQGTIDKYMGDAIMAFWGAPVELPDHAHRAVQAALDMVDAVDQFNRDRPDEAPLGVGIGLNTGEMSVGDMGSDVRRSYTVIGDAVNLGSRLEGLTRIYGVDIIASEATRQMAPGFVWQELDRVRVKGKARAVTIYTPLASGTETSPALAEELHTWAQFLAAWRTGDWYACEGLITQLMQVNAQKELYRWYAQRLASQMTNPPEADWDGTSVFETK